MLVVKLGGSFFDSAELLTWIKTIAEYGAGKLVLVPGGGPFAEHVRQAQKQHQFNDKIAHHMALNAMDQFGLLIIGIAETDGLTLVPARSQLEIQQALSAQQVPVWLPSNQLSLEQDIPQSWDVTSDSLAAWLTGKIGADQLVLIKHLHLRVDNLSFEALESQGMIDISLKHYARGASFDTRCLRHDQAIALQDMLENDNHAGAYIS